MADNSIIIEKIKERLGEGYEVSFKEMIKNNGVLLHGVMIMKEGESIAPTIYYDHEKDEDEIVGIVLSRYYQNVHNGGISLTIEEIESLLSDKEKVLEKVIPVLVNAEKNAEIDCVKTKFCDLNIQYRVDTGEGTILVTHSLQNTCGVTEKELYESAKKNASRVFENISMIQMIAELTGIPVQDCFEIENEIDIRVITSKNRLFGASSLICEECMKEVGEKLIVLPSSIHEVICIPYFDEADINYLVSMVKEVNQTSVLAQDYLSDNVYPYENGKMEVWK